MTKNEILLEVKKRIESEFNDQIVSVEYRNDDNVYIVSIPDHDTYCSDKYLSYVGDITINFLFKNNIYNVFFICDRNKTSPLSQMFSPTFLQDYFDFSFKDIKKAIFAELFLNVLKDYTNIVIQKKIDLTHDNFIDLFQNESNTNNESDFLASYTFTTADFKSEKKITEQESLAA